MMTVVVDWPFLLVTTIVPTVCIMTPLVWIVRELRRIRRSQYEMAAEIVKIRLSVRANKTS